MSKVIPFPPPQTHNISGDLRAAMACADLLQRAEAILMTVGVMARDPQIKALALFAQDATYRTRQRAEMILVTPPKGAA